MAEKRTYTCDVCGAEKRETNHWFVIFQRGEFQTIARFTAANLDTTHITPGTAISHVCGENCALKKTSEFLTAPPAIEIPEGAPKQ